MTRKALPKQVKINGTTYRVVAVPEITDEGKSCNGLTDLNQTNIQIDERLSIEAQKQTLRHEVAHVILYHLGLTLSEDEEERMANALGGMLAGLKL